MLHKSSHRKSQHTTEPPSLLAALKAWAKPAQTKILINFKCTTSFTTWESWCRNSQGRNMGNNAVKSRLWSHCFPDSSVGQESACNAGDSSSILVLGRSDRKWIGSDFPCGSAGKEFTCNGEDLGLIPGLGRPPGERKGCPLQYSGLENLNRTV